MKIIIINGPNLNLIGSREKEIYGTTSFEDYFESLKKKYNENIELTYFQSNIEGEIIDTIQKSSNLDGIILNAGGYSHTSVAIADAIASVKDKTKVIEVHISNIFSRESYRHTLITASKTDGLISGFGLKGYDLAIKSFLLS
ncbi:MAG: type II 3-dehydroquinate dehydratase [Bacteroidales bacterium]|jgi:3-dehydroquinate dehydratase-2